MDPAKIAARFTLIPDVFHKDYLRALEAEALLAAEILQEAEMSLLDGGRIMMMGAGPILFISQSNGLVKVEYEWATLVDETVDLLACSNLVDGDWRHVQLDILSSNITSGSNVANFSSTTMSFAATPVKSTLRIAISMDCATPTP